jgi:ABC-type transporter Mla maintaining outer membrane lipid asymmetry ATPase subunit MlaF
VTRTQATGSVVLEVAGVSKQYGALRPLRIDSLRLAQGEQIALLGLDQPAAEVFINLVTGATLPDTGTIRVFTRTTADIVESADWLTLLDRFGIVSDRAVLLDSLSVVQNLSMPFSLDIEPPPDDIRHKAIAIAQEVGLAKETWDAPVRNLDAPNRVRLHLARALALDPSLVIVEHPSARLMRHDVRPLGRHLQTVIAARGISSIVVTLDQDLIEAAGVRAVELEPATGRTRDARPGGLLSRIAFWKQ